MKKLKPYWVLTYSLNDYYGERDQFCCFLKYLKDIPAAIIKDEEINKRTYSNLAAESMDRLTRTNTDTFELVIGDHQWIAKKTLPFVATP